MKIVRVQTETGARYGRIVEGGETIELGHLAHSEKGGLSLACTGDRIARTSVRLLPPCEPSKIIGVGQNYRTHAREMGKPIPVEPILFMKPGTALLAPGGTIRRPAGFERVDFEGELAVVIGRRCHRVAAGEALSFVLGYSILNDVTVRDLQKRDGQFTRAKGFDTFAPFGPCIETELDPSDLVIVTQQSGRLGTVERQRSSTADMIFDVPTLVECISRVMTLVPGDVITTGTPSGVGPIEPGDVIRIAIDGIGVLENPVRAEDDTTGEEETNR